MPSLLTLIAFALYSFTSFAMDPPELPTERISFNSSMTNVHRKLHHEIQGLHKQIAEQTFEHFADFEEDSASVVNFEFPFFINFAKQVSRGTESEIYMARSIKDNTKCIARILFEKNRELSKKFEDEKEILSFLKLLKADYYIQGKIRPILIMEYIPGINLAHPSMKKLSPVLRAIIAKEILVSAQNFYRQGVFHRDINLSNLHVDVVNNWPIVRLVDFGNTCHMDKANNDFIGAPYMQPPEAFSKKQPNHNYAHEIHMVGKAMAYFLTALNAEEYYTKKESLSWCRHEKGFEGCVKCSHVEFLTACSDIFIKPFFDIYKKDHAIIYNFISKLRDTILFLSEPEAKDRYKPDEVDIVLKALNELEAPLKMQRKTKGLSIDLSSVSSTIRHSISPRKESPTSGSNDKIEKKKSNPLIRTSPKKSS